MRALKFLAILSGLFFIVSCNNSSQDADATENNDTTEAEVSQPIDISTTFPDLFQQLRTHDTSFRSSGFQQGEIFLSDTPPASKIDGEALSPYKQFLVYNTDSSMAIDYVSYSHVISTRKGQTKIEQGGPDSEAALLNFRDSSRKRILFMGSAGTILDAKWVDNQTLLLAASEEMEDGKMKPTIWEYRINTDEKIIYAYDGALKVDISNYTESRLNQKIKTTPSF